MRTRGGRRTARQPPMLTSFVTPVSIFGRIQQGIDAARKAQRGNPHVRRGGTADPRLENRVSPGEARISPSSLLFQLPMKLAVPSATALVSQAQRFGYRRGAGLCVAGEVRDRARHLENLARRARGERQAVDRAT